MLKAIEQLVKGYRSIVGNHRCTERKENGDEITDYIYHSTVICSVNYTRQRYTINNGGYDTMSTNRAIRDYRSFFQSLGFIESFEDLRDMCNYLVSLPYNRSVTVMYSEIEEPHEIVFSKDNNTEGPEKYAVIHFNTADNGETESFPFKGPKSLRAALAERFRFYLDENFDS